jgi:hypothetical protein
MHPLLFVIFEIHQCLNEVKSSYGLIELEGMFVVSTVSPLLPYYAAPTF